MEDTLGVRLPEIIIKLQKVLILVLMEDTLGVANGGKTQEAFSSLNPCSNGRYSRSLLYPS